MASPPPSPRCPCRRPAVARPDGGRQKWLDAQDLRCRSQGAQTAVWELIQLGLTVGTWGGGGWTAGTASGRTQCMAYLTLQILTLLLDTLYSAYRDMYHTLYRVRDYTRIRYSCCV